MWYDQGTISLVQGSVTVIGVGTDFVSNTRSGDMFVGPDGVIYEVANYANETTLAIKPAYKGPTISNTADYFVIPINGYVKIAADRLNRISLGMDSIDDDVAAAAGSAAAAAGSAAAAIQARTAAEAAQTSALNSKNSAAASEASALSSKNASKTSEDNSLTYKNQAVTARDQAVEAAAVVTGTISDRGNWSAAAGTYPAVPTESALWRVTVAGTVSGVVYRVGDNLIYSKTTGGFYKVTNIPDNLNLVALSALTGQADRIPMYSSSSAMSLLPAGVFGKSLLSASLDSEARAALGLVPTQNTTDTTAGRVLKVNDYGMGQAISITDANLANTVNGSSYKLTSPYTNGPTAAPYIIQCFIYDAEVTQIAYIEGQTLPALYIRQYRAGWNQWVKFATSNSVGDSPVSYLGNIDDTTAVPFGYTTVGVSSTGTKPPGKTYGMLLTIGLPGNGANSPVHQKWSDFDGAAGTKSQWVRDKYGTGSWGNWRLVFDQNTAVGTVVNPNTASTGAIMERGSNGNGEFIKFIDGTMICWRNTAPSTSTSYDLGSGWFGGDAFGGATPSTFISEPTVTCTIHGANTGTNTAVLVASCFSRSTTSSFGTYRALALTGTGLNFGQIVVKMIAVGRWY